MGADDAGPQPAGVDLGMSEQESTDNTHVPESSSTTTLLVRTATKRSTTVTTKRPTTTTTTPTTTTTITTTTTAATTTNTTTPPPTTTTVVKVPPSTTRGSSTPSVIHVGVAREDPAPGGYVIISTLPPPANSTDAGSSGKGLSGVTIGAIAGAGGGVVIIAVVVVVLLIILLRRRRRNNRQRIPKIDNPQYRTAQPNSYRFSRDSTLYVGNTVNLQTTNNNSNANGKAKDSPSKRKAPPPPNPFGDDMNYMKVNNRSLTDIYEQDSHASSENIEMGTFTARNYQASGDDDEDDDHRTPLIEKNADDTGSVNSETESAGAGSEEDDASSSGSESAGSSGSEEADDSSQTSDKVPLAKSVDSAGRMLDEYDKTKNPFVI